ncbi:tRNA lysidine(34) synthetase TilS [Pararhizobium antarcticum]|uniref:tRNA(Ile)-lysidine synthase n=1 Tax=Pararhizobium antarcticum TaxID=1798805 RepID=A0A657LN76_9HYPH|nr:tRNA lysidine(34) synthetase TilS [Pararhizobium antarcticum]OJF92231.1 hypothetical protein AX760_05775 [Pararhizobium antarcticum]OJF94887.1 hypothetical protein AX761_04530 [Rhizobium sp. 58]
MPAEVIATDPAAVLDAARQFLETFHTPGLVLVAVSGGSDSTGLLLALNEAMTSASGFSLAACTIDHALRAESAAEAQLVAQLCARLGIAHITRRWDGEKPLTGLQAAARGARYRLLSAVAHESGALCVVTGHSSNDQIETIAMRSSRSETGSTGLSGMADAVLFEQRTWVLRPFLGLDRAMIRAYLLARGEGWIDDPSNDADRFERVRVRRTLAENPDATAQAPDGALLERQALERRTLVRQSSARQAMAGQAAGYLGKHATVCGGLVARIDPAPVWDAGRDASIRGILALAACLGGRAYLPGRETTERLGDFIASGALGRLTAGRVVFDRRRSGLYLYREARNLPILEVCPGEEGVWDGRFRIENRAKQPIFVSAVSDGAQTMAGLIAAGVPDGVARRAAAAAPAVLVADPGSKAVSPVNVGIWLSPWDTFLPRFDLTLANQCATLFGRACYKQLPVQSVLAESAAF